MNAIKEACEIISSDPTSARARTLAQFVVALESRTNFPLDKLYDLEIQPFDLAMSILREWHINRVDQQKDRLLDVSRQLNRRLAH